VIRYCDDDSRAATFPLGAALSREVWNTDPYPVLAHLRRDEPITWSPAFGRWLVTSRDACIHVLRDTKHFTTESDQSPIQQALGRHMLTVDADHLRHRRPFQPEFRLSALETNDATSTFRRELAHRCLQSAGESFDLIPHATAFATRTMLQTVGLPLSWTVVAEAVEVFASALEGSIAPARAASSATDVRECVAALLSAGVGDGGRSEHGGILQRLRDGGSGLTEEEVGSNVLILLFGGIETTTSLIANTLWCMSQFNVPVSADAEVIGLAVDETLRFEPPVQTLTRYVRATTDLLGVQLEPGDTVECMIGAANRDPSHFVSPDVFDPYRHNNVDHLTLGLGVHHCIGNHLARREVVDFVLALVDLIPTVRIDLERTPAPQGHEFRRSQQLWANP
jgi:cytochrome P450